MPLHEKVCRMVVTIRIRVGESKWCCGLVIGLLAGCTFGGLLEFLHGGYTVKAAPKKPVQLAQPPPPPPPPPSIAPRQRRAPPPEPREEEVAVCVGGWLELTYPRRAKSVADNVLSVMKSEVFVAGTVRGGEVTEDRIAMALDGISALRPWFARTSVILMPTPADLRDELKGSGHFADYETQASKGGSGRFDFTSPHSAEPTNWVPIMMSPALGNPNGNTLQEFHYQSRCIRMINEHEASDARDGRQYERVMFTRLEFEWLKPHPPLSLLHPGFLWLPTGEDNTGLNDRHWLATRRDAEGVFRRWDALVMKPPHDIYHRIFFGGGDGKVRPAFMSSETFMKLHIQFHKVGVARFPNVAYLQCCSKNYEKPAAGALQMRCFAKGCTQTRCPLNMAGRSRQIGAAACAAGVRGGELGFKYRDEGFSAILHATALSFEGARWNVPADMVPPRLDIRLPASLGSELQRGGGGAAIAPATDDEDSYLFTCKTCESANFVDRVSYNVTACLFTEYTYEVPNMELARKGHNCRYFDEAPLAAVCRALESSVGELRSKYGWFCGDVLHLLEHTLG